MKQLFTRILSPLMVILLSGILSSATAQVVRTESFDGTTFLPTGWSAAPASSSTANWTRSTNGTNPTTVPHSGAGMARYNSRTANVGTIETIATPAFDLSNIGVDTAHVSLWVYRHDVLPTIYDTLNIMVNTTADTAGAIIIGTIARSRQIALPDTQATNGWYFYTFNIPASFTGASNYVLFRGVTRSGNGSGQRIYIDDISWDSYPSPCNGMPTAGSITSRDTLICGGTGAANLTLSGNTSGVTGLSIIWQSSTISGGPYTDFGADSTSINSGTLTSTTYFRCKVTCTATNDSAFTSEFTVVVAPNAAPSVTVSPTAGNYCVNSGTNAMLVASGAANYTWTPTTGLNSTTTDTVYASPNNSTTYTVTGYDSFGCFDTAIVRVSIRQTPTVTATPATATTCLGDSITLNATSAGTGGGGTTVTYTWTPGGLTGASIRVPVDSSITYYVNGTTNYGCTGTQSNDTVVITGLAVPIAGTITPRDTVICGGSGTTLLTLTNTTTGSGISYDWQYSASSTGPWTPIANNATTLTTDTLTSTLYYLCVVTCISNSATDTTAVQAVNVSPAPVPTVTVSPTAATNCVGGGPAVLIASGASFYSWTPATGLNSTNTDTVYSSPTNSTTYTVTGYDIYGCQDTAMVRVSNRTIPTVTVTPLTNTICEGDSITLVATATGTGGFGTTMSYTWAPDNLTGNTITVTPTQSTDYIVTGITNYGCTGDISVDTAAITVNQLTHAVYSFSAAADSATFLNASLNALTYYWSFGNGDTSTASDPTVHYTSDGTYPVTLIATGLCNSDTLTDTLVVIFDGIAPLSSRNLSIYPNPAHDFIRVDVNTASDKIEILDILGKTIQTEISSQADKSTSHTFDLKDLNTGIYIIRVTSGKSTQSIRFVKE